ncbi:MAG: superoxide dismutase [Candidatus Dojkabacteria bacterium]
MKYQLPELPYSFNALEPHIDSQTMEIHHQKHHGGYVDKLNAALEPYPDLQEKAFEELISAIKKLPKDIQGAVRNNGGGHLNHSLFWKLMSPNGRRSPEGKLAEKIDETFGSFEEFKTAFAEAATKRFGSGWAWLIVTELGTLEIVSTPNQDNPVMDIAEVHGAPILGLDVWEHAYYLKYQNKRADYIEAWWNAVDWSVVEENYALVK